MYVYTCACINIYLSGITTHHDTHARYTRYDMTHTHTLTHTHKHTHIHQKQTHTHTHTRETKCGACGITHDQDE